MNNIEIGKLGETAAGKLLVSKGFKILKKNARFGKTGEIDIIASDDKELVFVEVKTRKSSSIFGDPCEAVDYRKQEKIKRMAEIYLSGISYRRNLRFDIVEVFYRKDKRTFKIYKINHIENAFE